jgi:hypothetical protein
MTRGHQCVPTTGHAAHDRTVARARAAQLRPTTATVHATTTYVGAQYRRIVAWLWRGGHMATLCIVIHDGPVQDMLRRIC